MGRRFAYTGLNPCRTALVVIDIAPFHVAGNPYCLGIVSNIDALADTLLSADGTVAWGTTQQ